MKNIRKIAEEIFQAPTEEDLVGRVQRLTRDQLTNLLDRGHWSERSVQALLKAFPDGAYFVDNFVNSFSAVEKYVKSNLTGKWKSITSKPAYQLLEQKLKNGKNVIWLNSSVWNAYFYDK